MITRKQPIQKRSEVTIEKLRSAARTVIAREGRDRFTTSQIVAEAGVSVGILYRYWANRIDVLDDLYPNRTEGLGELAEGAPTPAVAA